LAFPLQEAVNDGPYLILAVYPVSDDATIDRKTMQRVPALLTL
jgi:hypothetical protein